VFRSEGSRTLTYLVLLRRKLSLQDTWQEMEKLVDDGLVKSIGISNFSCKKIDTLLSYARIKPVAVQVEVHPYFRNQKLVDHCKAKVYCGHCTLLATFVSNSVTILMHCSVWHVMSVPILCIVVYGL